MVAPLAMLGLSVAGDVVGGLLGTSSGAAAGGAAKTGHDGKLRKTADDFESVLLENTFDRLTQSTGEDGPLGAGGTGGDVYRSMLSRQYAGEVVKSGGVGISGQVYRQMLQMQEGNHGG